ncbi:unnamed protein product [Brassica oleracea var. botrytis]|uniref:Uncharacterized protein n=1 Tax=Brassica oleracea TaxID=3712 RepID=A0A3P6DMJ2_BRAOL|nr:unnamed protein product [Brassica oleracea]
MLQAKKSKENLKEITHKVYFDVEIDGEEAGMIMQRHPKEIIMSKIEENHVSAEEIGNGITQDHHIILKYEVASLEFDLIVFAP